MRSEEDLAKLSENIIIVASIVDGCYQGAHSTHYSMPEAIKQARKLTANYGGEHGIFVMHSIHAPKPIKVK